MIKILRPMKLYTSCGCDFKSICWMTLCKPCHVPEYFLMTLRFCKIPPFACNILYFKYEEGNCHKMEVMYTGIN